MEHFYLKQRQTNYGYSDLGIWKTFFSKMNKVSLSLQGKQLTELVAHYKFELLSEH